VSTVPYIITDSMHVCMQGVGGRLSQEDSDIDPSTDGSSPSCIRTSVSDDEAGSHVYESD